MSELLNHQDGLEVEVELENEIARLEAQLVEAKERLSSKKGATNPNTDPRQQHGQRHISSESASHTPVPITPTPSSRGTPLDLSSQHYLLLLSDSALPLGSFAFSSGLESYLAHGRSSNHSSTTTTSNHYKPTFSSFLPLSLSSYASTSLPFTLAAHRDPSALSDLDDVLDASIICTVGRRASIAQGRALLSIWEKSFSHPQTIATTTQGQEKATSVKLLVEFSSLLRKSQVSAHLAPLFGAVSANLGLSLRQTAYVFLLSHAKALASAAVRAGVFGPYQAQKVLASAATQELLADLVEKHWDVPFEEAGQSVPVMDLWIGRHEMLYSRIFNS
ncbi:UreF-domain-containing protein [Poronia punctata]|nr:UreF-domain-containing protein [Poronia punctata]